MIPLPRFLFLMTCVPAVLALSSCMDSPESLSQQKDALERDIEMMKEKIAKMHEEDKGVAKVENLEQLLVDEQKTIFLLEQKNNELDDYITALTLRRDALKLKLDQFRINHPSE